MIVCMSDNELDQFHIPYDISGLECEITQYYGGEWIEIKVHHILYGKQVTNHFDVLLSHVIE